jgi:hypothetical protein
LSARAEIAAILASSEFVTNRILRGNAGISRRFLQAVDTLLQIFCGTLNNR